MSRREAIRFLSGTECLQAKSLWQEVFTEDSALFTDYYFRVKAPQNEGLVLEGEEGIRAMLYLTPEKMCIFGETVPSAYVVGVATRQQYRHRGYMARLLQESFAKMYEQKLPFLFLMPALAAIYEPFGFRFIYDRPQWDADSLRLERLRPLKEEAIGCMAAFSQDFLKKAAAVHIFRDAAYDKVLMAEIAAQEGTIFGCYENEGGTERLSGLCLYTCEDGQPEIQEVLADPVTEAHFVTRKSGKKPCIMARIIHLPTMLSLLRTEDSRTTVEFVLHVTDSRIAENNGYFLCKADAFACLVQRVDKTEAVRRKEDTAVCFWSGDIADLVQLIFGYESSSAKQSALWKKLRVLSPVWINEIV